MHSSRLCAYKLNMIGFLIAVFIVFIVVLKKLNKFAKSQDTEEKLLDMSESLLV